MERGGGEGWGEKGREKEVREGREWEREKREKGER
jgi:hypothetical protein